MHSIKFLSHICCRRRIVDAQWFGNGYAVCLNMIHNMGTIFQTLLGFGTNHSREHWKLHWKIVSDCVCYSQVSKRCVEACKVALKAFRWNVLFSLMHMQCSFLDPFRVACFIKGHFKRTCFDTCVWDFRKTWYFSKGLWAISHAFFCQRVI